ncbi:NADH-quinone oxidoreductase subunit K [Ectothiorhodospira lacustris]|uniref:NADH-quinone oxidoreductase subunit K n=1 Tax=Ectothiorhodospira lacustris TaxID=2899127 RepID=UPI001EE84CEB|nr:NADH-quinone oxidoreductase subunit K [Ectothiorhodospira lacustris]
MTLTITSLYGLLGAALVGLGLYGLLVQPHPLRKILAFNVMGGGLFLVFGVVVRRGAAAGFPADPVPQAFVITAIMMALAGTALAVAIMLRLFAETGRVTLRPEPPASSDGKGGDS